MPVAAKASWTVTWGIIPGDPMGEKTFMYTSADYDADQGRERNRTAVISDWKPGDLSIFEKRKAEANYLMLCMQDGSKFNWVTLDWIWY